MKEGKNSFSSPGGGTTANDIRNGASYDARSADLTLGVGSLLTNSGAGAGTSNYAQVKAVVSVTMAAT